MLNIVSGTEMDTGQVRTGPTMDWIGLGWVRLGQICKLQLNFIMCCWKEKIPCRYEEGFMYYDL